MNPVASSEPREQIQRLAADCLACYQCGQCTSACPSGADLDRGPRRVVRLILAGDAAELLSCDDVWRCTECGSCTEACPMEVDAAAAMAAIRELQRQHGGASCPERRAADVATRRLERHPRIDNLAFGTAMAAGGMLPKDLVGSAAQGAKAARNRLARTGVQLVEMAGTSRRRRGLFAKAERSTDTTLPATNEAALQPFFAGCALPQDTEAYRLTRKLAADLGLGLTEAPHAGCCGHPARGERPATYSADGASLTVCPACDAGLREIGQPTQPLWDALTAKARRDGRKLVAAAPSFVPYVGCLGPREETLDALTDAAILAGAELRRSYPSLHAACCGALGGMFRGETTGTRRLLDFAAAAASPVVTTCLLCRDNLRSAVRLRKLPVDVYYWPEFFSAASAIEPGTRQLPPERTSHD